ncbi:putative 3'-5' exoribonuclease [Aeromonas phage BUCT552]|nr:putative 3'-5' exoribonuclease [Aeromonas phage BUCT552]
MSLKNAPVWGPYRNNLDGFVYPVPRGERKALHRDPQGRLKVYSIGADGTAAPMQFGSPDTKFWAQELVDAVVSTSVTLCGMESDRQTMEEEGVVVEVIASSVNARPVRHLSGAEYHLRWRAAGAPTGITALWAIPAGAWARGKDEKNLSIRLAQMHRIVQQAGFTDLNMFAFPAIRTVQVIPPNPWNPAIGVAEGCRSFPVTARQIDFILCETEMAPLVIDHEGFWSRKSKAVRMATPEDVELCHPSIDEEL